MMDLEMNHNKEFWWKKVKAIIHCGVQEELIVKDCSLN